jgi:hypothetical protein
MSRRRCTATVMAAGKCIHRAGGLRVAIDASGAMGSPHSLMVVVRPGPKEAGYCLCLLTRISACLKQVAAHSVSVTLLDTACLSRIVSRCCRPIKLYAF